MVLCAWGGFRYYVHGEGLGIMCMGRVLVLCAWGGFRYYAHGEGLGIMCMERV